MDACPIFLDGSYMDYECAQTLKVMLLLFSFIQDEDSSRNSLIEKSKCCRAGSQNIYYFKWKYSPADFLHNFFPQNDFEANYSNKKAHVSELVLT